MGGAGLPCGGVELLSDEGKQGGPPGLRTVGTAFSEVWEMRRVVRRERCWSNQASRESLVVREGGGGTVKSWSSGTRAGLSVRDRLGEGGGGEVN